MLPKELSCQDGQDVFEMIQEMGQGENGFMNRGFQYSIEEFPLYLANEVKSSSALDLKLGRVPQTTYWLYVNNKPVGIGKLRHRLNEDLMINGGHIGYAVRPSERGKGYGRLLLQELLKKASEIGIESALITCNEDNLISRKVVEANGGTLEKIVNGSCKYWVETDRNN